jgi:anthranilate synthase component 1
MFTALDINRFFELAKEHKRISVFREFPSDRLTPIQAFEALGEMAKEGTILESALFDQKKGRFSHIFIDPAGEYAVHSVNKNGFNIDEKFNELRRLLKDHKCFISHDEPHMLGGVTGFITYDSVRFFEDIPDRHDKTSELPEIFFRFYNTVITFDHQAGKITVSTIAQIDDSVEEAYQIADRKLNDILLKIASFQITRAVLYNHNYDRNKLYQTSVNIDDESFKKLVVKAKEFIHRGDAFQIVLSRQFYKYFSVPPFQVYRALRLSNPSPYMFFIEYNGTSIAGSSPERLASVKNRIIETHPIAGTRKRGTTTHDDRVIAEDLLTDKKEVAEHVMLVDLARNDIGSVSEPGSVNIRKFKDIQHLSKVMHITSVVEGKLADGKDALDGLRAVFPAGTLSGAPKIRAMEIIDELEPCRRALYGGAVCFIDNDGNLESCIAIRMAIMKDGKATVQSGCGIVFDSDPASETEETRSKASAILNGLDLAEGGLCQ